MDADQVNQAVSGHMVRALEIARSAAGKMRPGGTLLLMGGAGGRRVSRSLGIISAATAALPPFTATLALERAGSRQPHCHRVRRYAAVGVVARRSTRRAPN